MNVRRSVSVSVFAFGFMIIPSPSLSAPAQYSPAQPSAKQTLTLSGKVAQKGAMFISQTDRKSYRVLNSDTLLHFDGQYVTLKARCLSAERQLYVTAVRPLSTAVSAETAGGDHSLRR